MLANPVGPAVPGAELIRQRQHILQTACAATASWFATVIDRAAVTLCAAQPQLQEVIDSSGHSFGWTLRFAECLDLCSRNNGTIIMLRIIALLFVLLLIGFKLTKYTTVGSQQQARNANPTRVDAEYKATHRVAEDLLDKFVESRKQRTTQTSVDTPAEPHPKSNKFAYSAKILDAKIYLAFCDNPNPRYYLGPFVKTSENKYVCDIDGLYSRRLWKDSDHWLYDNNQLQMAPVPVDGSVLEKRLTEINMDKSKNAINRNQS